MTLATLMVSTGAQEFSKEYGLLDKTYNTACKGYSIKLFFIYFNKKWIYFPVDAAAY